MRCVYWFALCVLMGFAGMATAEEEPAKKAAPALTEQGVRSATLALRALLLSGDRDAAEDGHGRYIDDRAFMARVQGAPASWKEGRHRAKLRAALADIAALALSQHERDAVEDAHQTKGRGMRMVELGSDASLAWGVGPQGPLLIDVRYADTWMSGFLAKAKRDRLPAQHLAAFAAGGLGEEAIRRSKDNLSMIVTLLIERRTGKVTGGWPRYSGKNFVLSIVAFNILDRRRRENFEVLFSPGSGRSAPALTQFQDVNKKSLKRDGAFGALTDYAGRRNTERDYLITPDQEKMGTAIIADLHFDDVAIVGFTDGSVRVMTREELGLKPGDPIVAGDKSKSELLQYLSDR